MTDNINELSVENFKEFIKEGKCIVDFYADWCMPCQRMKTIFENVAKELSGKIKFGKLNIEGNEEITQEYLVMSIPTLIFFRDGEEISRINGLVSEEEIKKSIKATFK